MGRPVPGEEPRSGWVKPFEGRKKWGPSVERRWSSVALRRAILDDLARKADYWLRAAGEEKSFRVAYGLPKDNCLATT